MLREEIARCVDKQQQNQPESTSTRYSQHLDSHFKQKNSNNTSKTVSHRFKPRIPLSSISSLSPIFLSFFPYSPLLMSSTIDHCHLITSLAKMDHQYYLPFFLFMNKDFSLSQFQHYFFMWINATLKPKLRPIFWIWLSQPQRLLIRSRLHKRMRRPKKNIPINNNNIRRNHRFQWYGMYPIPPTRRTRAIWNKKLVPVPPPPAPHSPPSQVSDKSNSDHLSPRLLDSPLLPPSPPPQPPQSLSSYRKRKNWMPPINSETVQELSIANIFKSIQLRHDLLFDPHLSFRPNLDGTSGREKCRKAQRYWRRVNHAIQSISSNINDDQRRPSLNFLRVILSELQKIIISLYSPFASTPASNEPWYWPPHISLDHFCTVFDVDFIIHQIQHGLFRLDSVIHLIMDILTPLCPSFEISRLTSLHCAIFEENFGNALRQCFSILEVIKLDCANRILHQYRPYLLETCSKIEFHCFKRQLDNGQIKLDSAYNWIQHHWKQQSKEERTCFFDVYHQGIIEIISTNQLGTQPSRFPITLQFDERRLTQQLRQEFQSLMVISIVLIPYRYIAGPFATSSDMARLKRTCIELCKDCAMVGPTGNIFTFFDGGADDGDGGGSQSVLQIGYRLAYKACHRAFQAHYRHHVLENQRLASTSAAIAVANGEDDDTNGKVPLLSMESLGADQLCQVSQFWANWLLTLLKARNSRLYTLIHERLCDSLCFISQHGSSALAENAPMMATMDLMVGIQDTVVMLGDKLKILADLNLETFGSIYKVLALDIIQQKVA